MILQKSLRSFAGLLLSPELAKSTCGLCEFVQCAQLSLERAVDLRIFSVSAVSNVKIVFVFLLMWVSVIVLMLVLDFFLLVLVVLVMVG